VVKVIGEAVVQMVAEGQSVTDEAIVQMIDELSDREIDLAVEFAIDMLKR